ncbi:hypothetical protein FACS1894199_07220 [Bacteroidia bacterium]|nr:hypothetical protein FACS1894199_07220 [Bacteroidia bacterium]
MKGIELLSSLSDEQKKLLEISELNYRRFARIYFQIISYADDELVVKVWQIENQAGKYLTTAELAERTKDVFKEVISDNVKLHVCPLPFSKEDLEKFSIKRCQYQNARIRLTTQRLGSLA